MIRTYAEILTLQTFRSRYDYLKLSGRVGVHTFGYDRYLNQLLYSSGRWRRIRDKVIIRDNGCDLADADHEIISGIIVHHLNPLTPEDIEHESPICFDMNNLICTSPNTHKAIHYGDENLLPQNLIVRSPGDTILW